jgi:hypothetical protein
MCTFHRRLPANKTTLSRTKKERGKDRIAGDSCKCHVFSVTCWILIYMLDILKPKKNVKFTALENDSHFHQNYNVTA